MTPDGFVSRASTLNFADAVERLTAAITKRGLSIMAKIDHAAAAASAGMELRPTLLLIFGNPRGGTPLMQAAQTAGIDLPLKILMWQDADRKTQIAYNDPVWIAKRHGLDAKHPAVVAMAAALDAIAHEAAGA